MRGSEGRVRRALVSWVGIFAYVLPTGCDRSSDTPSADNSNRPVPAVGSEGAGVETVPAVDANRPSAAANDKPTVKTPSQDRASPSSADEPVRPSASSDFTPPEIDMSALTEFERDAIGKLREKAINAPGSADRIAELGGYYVVRDFTDAAILCYRRAIALMPGVMKYHYMLALALEDQGDRDGTIAAFRRCLELEGSYVPVYVNLGRLMLESDVGEARALFEKAVALDPSDSTAQWGIGQCAEAQGREDEALEAYRKAIELQPDYRDAHERLADMLRRRGDTDAAARHADAAKKGRKGLVRNDSIRFQLSTYMRSDEDVAADALKVARQGRADEAVRFLRQSMRRGLQSETIRRALGEVHMIQGRYDDALIQFDEALKINPDSTAAKVLKASCMIEVGELDAAERLLKAIGPEAPERPVAVNRLGVIEMKRGNPTAAEALFREAVAASPGNATYQFNLAQCLSAQGRREEGLAVVRKAAELDAESAPILLLKGRLLLDAGAHAEVIDVLKRAVALNPKLETAWTLLATAAREQGDHRGSIAFLEEGLRQAPDSGAIANDLAYTLAACPEESLRNPTRAVELAKRACVASLNSNANYIDTLAAAHAAAGNYSEAVESMRLAIDKMKALGASEAELEEMRTRLAEYESRIR